jgi:single-stranded-DNA-specific exonuclease
LAYRLVTDRYQGQARVQLMIEAHDESSDAWALSQNNPLIIVGWKPNN